jgi:ribonuclease BN (tRNA processing enzyme)
MNIKLLGAHNCESKNTRFACLPIDAGGLTSSLPFAAQLKLKAILLTHQHYDHIKDIPVIAMNFYLSSATIEIYATATVFDSLTTYLMDGKIYPNFLERPRKSPTIKFTTIEPLKPLQIWGYSVLPVPVKHSAQAVGYQITSANGKVLFYTGDTGSDLNECWEHVSPQLLIIEVTGSNRYEESLKEGRHLTPSLLRRELAVFQKMKGYLPQVVTVHMNPHLKKELKVEIAAVAGTLNHDITPGYEGMQIHL